MMHSNKLVVAIKVNGNVLREDGDSVSLPFGIEYSILVKNLDSVRTQVSISVDGKNATDGCRLIVNPNSSIDLERFIRNGNLTAGNKFKFIERTTAIEEHRGIKEDDGLVRVEAWRERVTTFVDVPMPRYCNEPMPKPFGWPYSQPYRRPVLRCMSANTRMKGPSASAPTMRNPPRADRAERSSPAGITVAGAESQQRFHNTPNFPVEPASVVIVLRLRGEVGGWTVTEPITVKCKLECGTCGKKNQANSQFCSQCGTALSII